MSFSRSSGLLVPAAWATALALFALAAPIKANDLSLESISTREPPTPDPRVPEPKVPTSLADAPVAFDHWRGLSFGAYLAPVTDFVAEDGGFDVVVHFHGGEMAEKELKASGVNAVFVACGFGIGSNAYSSALASPLRFQAMLDELVKTLALRSGKANLRIRNLALASWSAGFTAVGKVLGVDRYYGMVDTVILNDSLHSQYLPAGATENSNVKLSGASDLEAVSRVDLRMIRSFVRFARDASLGTKAMTMTHSAIAPHDYASSTEATQALLTAIEVPLTRRKREEEAPSANWRGLTLTNSADSGNLHVRGFRGRGPRDHVDQLYLIGESLKSALVPRWKHEGRLVYTRARE